VAHLIYSTIMSLDGYSADESGSFDFAAPDEEVHALVNDLERPIGTFLLGRRMYEVMKAWETIPAGDDQVPVIRDFAEIWRAADKIVFSRSLRSPSSAKTRIEREFDPDGVRRLKERSERDLSIGGPELASLAFGAGLVDECQVVTVPVLVGGGLRAFQDGRVNLKLLDQHSFQSGAVYMRYDVGAG
jgi:dihydrofolate reductase